MGAKSFACVRVQACERVCVCVWCVRVCVNRKFELPAGKVHRNWCQQFSRLQLVLHNSGGLIFSTVQP